MASRFFLNHFNHTLLEIDSFEVTFRLSLFTETNQYYVDDGNGITRTVYPHGNTLFAFDLTADLGAASGHWELVKHGSIRLEIHFSQALTATINTIIYAEFDNLLQIDRSKNVIFDYSSC